ncbi:flocculation protein FLO11-like [Miscanthus floridulus]|uniref:flocculation protein FLO11-like n=1 Tax=Miscanthus floridulus TaxID=154761 RepID=UPI00345B08E4
MVAAAARDGEARPLPELEAAVAPGSLRRSALLPPPSSSSALLFLSSPAPFSLAAARGQPGTEEAVRRPRLAPPGRSKHRCHPCPASSLHSLSRRAPLPTPHLRRPQPKPELTSTASSAAGATPLPGLADAAAATLLPGSAGSEAPRRPTPSCPPRTDEAPRAPPSPPPKPGAAVAAAPSRFEAEARRDEDRGPPAWFAALVAVGLYIVVRSAATFLFFSLLPCFSLPSIRAEAIAPPSALPSPSPLAASLSWETATGRRGRRRCSPVCTPPCFSLSLHFVLSPSLSLSISCGRKEQVEAPVWEAVARVNVEAAAGEVGSSAASSAVRSSSASGWVLLLRSCWRGLSYGCETFSCA